MGFLLDIFSAEAGARAQKRWPNSFLPAMLILLVIIGLLLWIVLA
jgi:hypothetical protein